MARLLDTSIAVLLRDADTEADDRVNALDDLPLLSVITQVELEGGVVAKPPLQAKRRWAVDLILATFPVLPFEGECVTAYRRIVEATGYSRRKVVDRMIAATALANGLTLVTLNGRDFTDIPGLKLEVWPVF